MTVKGIKSAYTTYLYVERFDWLWRWEAWRWPTVVRGAHTFHVNVLFWYIHLEMGKERYTPSIKLVEKQRIPAAEYYIIIYSFIHVRIHVFMYGVRIPMVITIGIRTQILRFLTFISCFIDYNYLFTKNMKVERNVWCPIHISLKKTLNAQKIVKNLS